MRNRVSGALYALLHPDIGVGLAEGVARTSRDYSAKPELVEAMARFAAEKLATGFDAVILGHSHVPELRHVGAGVYLNVGDWVKHFTYGVMRDGAVALEEFRG
jgi:UDP-2,3-diacylglucosamine hydrolase